MLTHVRVVCERLQAWHAVVAVLLLQAVGALVELASGALRPPGHQVSVRVVLAADVIESVRVLVADHRSDRAVVEHSGGESELGRRQEGPATL